jgi:hypothetical protein
MKPDQIRATIEPIYAELFGAQGFEGLEVRVGVDHADEPAIFISAKILGVVDAELEARVARLRERVLQVVRQTDDGRFPYIWVAFDDPEGEALDETRSRRRRAS